MSVPRYVQEVSLNIQPLVSARFSFLMEVANKTSNLFVKVMHEFKIARKLVIHAPFCANDILHFFSV